MACKNRVYQKSSFLGRNTAPQVITDSGQLIFSEISTTGCSIDALGVNAIMLEKAGLYLITVNVTYTGTAADAVIQVNNNGVPISGATATIGATTATPVSITTLVGVNESCNCVSNLERITVEVTGSGTASNYNVTVVKLA